MSTGSAEDRWAWSGIPESIARALRGRGREVIRVSCDLPQPLDHYGASVARRIPGLAVVGHDAAPLVALRTARLRRLDPVRAAGRIVVFGSTFQTPRVDATFDDRTVAQLPDLPRSPPRERWRRRQGAIYRAASRCFTSSKWAAASIRDDYSQPPEKVVVAGFGPNIVCRPVPKEWSRPRLLWVGVDWRRKGGDVLLDAFRKASIQDATLDLVGQHPRIDTPGVTGHGLIRDPNHLRAMFEAATLFILPSRFDASPIVCLEAATAGTPIIATCTGGTAEHVGDAGLLINPGDAEGLAAAIRQASKPAVAARYRTAALAQSGTHTWANVADRMINALDGGGR